MKSRKKNLAILLVLLALFLLMALCLASYRAVTAHADTEDAGMYAAETFDDGEFAKTLAESDEDWTASDDYLFLKAFNFAIIMGLVFLVLYVVLRWVAMRQVKLFRRYGFAEADDDGNNAPDISLSEGTSFPEDKGVSPDKSIRPAPQKIGGSAYVLGITFGSVFAALGAYLATFLPMYSNWNATGETLWLYLLIAIPAFLMFACYVPVVVNSYKHSKKVTAVLAVLASVFAAACVVCYCVFIPDEVLALSTKILTSIITLATELLAVTFIIPLDRKYESPAKLATERSLYPAK